MTYRREDVPVLEFDFEAIPVGHRAVRTHTLTRADVEAFAALTGDYNPLHVDEEFASTTMFHKPVVHGMLSASFISTMIGTQLPGSGALWTSQSLEFLRPAFQGDTLTITSVVAQKSEASRMLVLETSITNQHGQELIKGTSTVKALPKKKEATRMKESFEPRTILVSGGGKGIGAAIAEALALAGHRVVINFKSSSAQAKALEDRLQGLGCRVVSVRADVSNSEDVQSMSESLPADFGPIQDCIHCAAPNPAPVPFGELDWETFKGHLDVQVGGAFNLTKSLLPSMVERTDGSFIFIGSIFAEGVPPVQQSAYVSAKAALAAFARSLAVEFGPKGIRVNVIAPGMTQTDMLANIPDKTKMLAKMNTPLRRLAEPSDIAEVALFLIGTGGRHISGETIRVCGGIVM